MTRRLLLSYLSLILLVLLGLEIPLGMLYANGETNRFIASVERDAVLLAERAEEAIEERKLDEVPGLIGKYALDTGGRVVVVDARGDLLADSQPDAPRPADEPAIAVALGNQHLAVVRAADQLGESDQVFVAVPAASGTTIRGALTITRPTTIIDTAVQHVWTVLAAVGLAALAAAAGIAVALARWVVRPVRALEEATNQLASGGLTDLPAADLGPPELRRLATTFTDTAQRLHHLLHAQRAFAADASHQLKTPLTALRLRLENLEPDLHPHARSSLDAAVAETDRLARMVQGLLALARLEDTAHARTPIDLDAVIADRAEGWGPFAGEHHITVTVTGAPVGRVWAAPGALEQILDNLLANALRAAPTASTITVHRNTTSSPTGDLVEIHIIDDGPGMPPADRMRAFDRFWRAPNAHDDGSGLGLTLVAQLTRVSGGHIQLDTAPRGGLDAVLRLQPVTTASGRHRTSPPAPTAVSPPPNLARSG